MTSQQPFQREPASTRDTKTLDRFVGICGAGRLKPAAPAHQQRQICLVKSQRHERKTHAGTLRRSFYALGIRRDNSAASVANSAFATLLFGCMTMSHPVAISRRWQRTISRTRRRMRLRTTAPPSAFLMLNPNLLCGSSFARRKTVKWEFERRFPARYTASKSPRRTSRASRGKSSRPALNGCEPMTALLAACRKHLAASGGLHTRTKSVRFGPPAFARLISALWQSNPPLVTCAQDAKFQIQNFGLLGTRRPEPSDGSQAAPAATCESVSVVDPRAHGQESAGAALCVGTTSKGYSWNRSVVIVFSSRSRSSGLLAARTKSSA